MQNVLYKQKALEVRTQDNQTCQFELLTARIMLQRRDASQFLFYWKSQWNLLWLVFIYSNTEWQKLLLKCNTQNTHTHKTRLRQKYAVHTLILQHTLISG